MAITLRPYQEAILASKAHLSSWALFAGTGSGKTYMSLSWAMRNPTNKILIICPRRVVEQWEESVEALMPNAKVMKFKKSWTAKNKNDCLKEHHKDYNVFIFNYEIITSITNLQNIVNDKFSIILDESHKIKEVGTKRKPKISTYKVISLGDKTPYKIALTATPTQKQLGGYVDYWAQLRFLGYYNINNSYDWFCDRYVLFDKMSLPSMPFPIKVIKAYRRQEEIEDLLKKVSVRYVPKFTDKDPTRVTVPLTKPNSYSKLCKERWYGNLDLSTSGAMRIAKKTMTSGSVAGKIGENKVVIPDNTIKIDWLMDFIEGCDDNILVFYKYNVERDLITSYLRKAGIDFLVIDGNLKDKYTAVKNSDVKVYLGQFNACSESLDGLQYKTHTCVYYAMPESSLEYKQSLGRIYRDGQKFSPNYYFLVMQKTIDSIIYDMLMKKIEFSEEILNKLSLEENYYEICF